MSGRAADAGMLDAHARPSGTFLGHPKGLAYLVFTEAWERFSFYGMQALLVLYMTGRLLRPPAVGHVVGFPIFQSTLQAVFGPLSTTAMATQVVGLYIGLTYLAPIFGGLAGDLFIGRRRAVILGGVVMAAGHFMMAFEETFLFALAALVTGCGLLKGNIAAQVGALYAPEDQRRDRAFSLYYIGINLGAFIAPLICGTLGEVWGWDYGFALAGVGMLVGLGIYLAGTRLLPPEASREGAGRRIGLTAQDRRALAALTVVLVIAILYWTAQSQVWNAYPLWIRDRVDRDLFGLTIPITWFQSIDALSVLALAPATIWIWRRQSKREAEPDDLMKIAIGCAIFAAACLWLSLGEVIAGKAMVPALCAIAFHFICAWGYLYFAPVVIALFTRSGPAALSAMMVAIYYVSLFVGSLISGWLGRFYAVVPNVEFWLIHAAVVGLGSGLAIIFRRPLARALRLGTKESA